ncbi:ASCH domain-containing protein [Clostridioides difficile]|uniref:ASCH domain-containing protein n=1 Tax=Clostridioides difficile TaxID=1496 RepID=UPI00202EB447|nr:ASCH domain-containing protein [Clostridioides difficile]MCM0739728.1 ASCH domain-containing protein [Clostridioides difficile]HBF2930476.1 ASCH domain-containing protein [Clostridioides difficile]HBF2935860.1 ASCH domain-containing protein [Clostridioides difficile]HBZ0282656.1 ASCH domain-containing protein [Clostridioides difficile]
MKCLIVKEKWADLILSGEKTLELRSRNTKVRGTIGIIKSGTGLICGTVDILSSYEITDEEYIELKNKHKVPYLREQIKYKKIFAWELHNPVKYKDCIKYKHKKGCVIWINI